jgi:anti-sigma-K factor RskA
MTCEEMKDMFELYSLGILEPDERSEIDAHLSRNCPECRRSLEDAMAINAALLGLAPEVDPPARVKRRLMAGLGVERPGWGWLAAMAAAGMLVIALWLGVQERRKEAELADARRTIQSNGAERERVRQALLILDEPDARQVAFGQGATNPPHGNVFIQARRGVLLMSTNLPPLPAGKIYEMWVIPKGSAPAPRPAGLFQSDATGSALHVLPGPIEASDFSAVAVTVEPEAGSTAPTTTPIIVAALQ